MDGKLIGVNSAIASPAAAMFRRQPGPARSAWAAIPVDQPRRSPTSWCPPARCSTHFAGREAEQRPERHWRYHRRVADGGPPRRPVCQQFITKIDDLVIDGPEALVAAAVQVAR